MPFSSALPFLGALKIKKDATSALAWCLLIIFIPLLGAILFVLLGYQSVDRPLARKRRHRRSYRGTPAEEQATGRSAAPPEEVDKTWEGMARLADRLDAYPLTHGNKTVVFDEGAAFFDSLYAAIDSATHHIHIEIYIFGYDDVGKKVLAMLRDKAKRGVQVRLVYDAVGTRTLGWWRLRQFRAAGGKAAPFLPVSILKRRFRVNLRNHRKIIVIDGRIAFTGGMNIGDDYVSKGPLGHWRDTMMQIEGPAVAACKRPSPKIGTLPAVKSSAKIVTDRFPKRPATCNCKSFNPAPTLTSKRSVKSISRRSLRLENDSGLPLHIMSPIRESATRSPLRAVAGSM